VGRTIAGQYGTQQGSGSKHFGRVDPWCAIAVVPILGVAGLFFWSDIAILGVVLIVLVLLIVLVDSWANRPLKRTSPRDPDDY
jgi:hypothetical protein